MKQHRDRRTINSRSAIQASIVEEPNVQPVDKLALAMVNSAVGDMDDPNHARQLFALDWLLDEGEMIVKYLEGSDASETVLDWLVRRIPDAVAVELHERLGERMRNG